MRARKSMIGIMAVCALALSAFAAASAQAGVTLDTCTTTGQTAGSEKFSDADCTTTSKTGSFVHKEIPVNTATTLTAEAKSNQVLSSEIGGLIKITLTGKKVSVSSGSVSNTSVGGVMGASGTATLTYEEVTSNIGCTVSADDGTVGHVNTKPLKFTVTPNGAMSGKVSFSPSSGSVFAVIHLSGCLFAGNYNVEGSVFGTTSGAILKVTKATSSLTLEGEPAAYEGEATIKGNGTAISATEL